MSVSVGDSARQRFGASELTATWKRAVCDARLIVLGAVPAAHLCAGRVYHVCVLRTAEREHQHVEQAVPDAVGVRAMFVRAECRAMRCRVVSMRLCENRQTT